MIISMRNADWLRNGLIDLISNVKNDSIKMIEVGSYAGESADIFASQDKVKEIWDAKGYKGDDGAKVTKDAVRIGILETQFNEYLKQHPFDTED